MIWDTGRQLYQSLFLPARAAAQRFVPRGVKLKARETCWRPLVLRWRIRGKNLTKVIIRRVAATKFVSFPQFNLYLANYQTHHQSTSLSRGQTLSTRVSDTRVIRDEARVGGRSNTPSLESPIDYRPTLPPNQAGQSSQKRSDSGMTQLSASRPNRSHSGAAQLLHPRKYLTPRPALTSVRPFKSKDEVTTRFKPQLQILHYWPTPLAPISRNQSNPSVEPAHQSKRLQPQFYKAEELVWRRVSKTTDINERVRHQESIESSDGSVRSVADQPVAVDVARVMESIASTPITKLHPALMDQLANDVIRRVEQRVRIERERRGL